MKCVLHVSEWHNFELYYVLDAANKSSSEKVVKLENEMKITSLQ